MKTQQPVSRRFFLKQAALGAAATPFFLKMLETAPFARENAREAPLFWIEGRSAGLQRTDFFSDRSVLDALKGRFDFQIQRALSGLNESDAPMTAADKILVFEGDFDENALTDEDRENLSRLLPDSRAAVLIGNEASFGKNSALLRMLETRNLPFIRLTGLPVHRHHILGTLGHLYLFGIPALDELNRPRMHYGKVVCDYCEYNGDFLEGNFANYFGEKEACLFKLGCKGPFTKNTCPTVRWNDSGTWCVAAGAPCSGCSEESFPDHAGYGLTANELADSSNFFLTHSERISKIFLTLTVFGAAVHAVSLKPVEDSEAETPAGREE